MTINYILRLFRTVKYLKIKQLFYQVFYRLRKILFPLSIKLFINRKSYKVDLIQPIYSVKSFDNYSFTFLNIEKKMENGNIDWDDEEDGKLWAYNLNYFDFLMQEGIDLELGQNLIEEFISGIGNRHNGLEPYPISLRGINWIKFLTLYGISSPEIDDSLYSQYYFLTKNIEYHLLGNHLLENGLSLLIGAYYFKEEYFYKLAKKIISKELNEQILDDGAHFELSPMYHQIILYRILDCINYLKHSDWHNRELLILLESNASKMLGWLDAVTFSDGSIPMVNDSAFGIAPNTSELFDYAARLGIVSIKSPLTESGYRVVNKKNYELFIDIGKIGPDYIPGHAHSDILNFLLYINGNPVITEVGTSTYENNPIRHNERSTASHNTVSIDSYEQNETWGAFRIGRRASIKSVVETDNYISATHNGFKLAGVYHKRTFEWSEKQITIKDFLIGKKRTGIFNIHFSPMCDIKIENNNVYFSEGVISFKGMDNLSSKKYRYAIGFNKTDEANVVSVFFTDQLITEIEVKS